ncbi:MAG: hypothetical protein KJ571_01610 [Bacteroidetes bacterium]|nr:hypothetical protein [Bacteroidota bacterium]
MPILIKTFSDNSVLEFDKGKFDNFCVYLTQPNIPRYAPKDAQYFDRLQQLGKVHSSKKLYQDFLQIYNATNGKIETKVLNLITTISQNYGNDSLEIDKLLTTIYAGMVAEENKAFTKLGKRIKNLGVYQVLIDSLPFNTAANFSKGKKWRELDAIMIEKGI